MTISTIKGLVFIALAAGLVASFAILGVNNLEPIASTSPEQAVDSEPKTEVAKDEEVIQDENIDERVIDEGFIQYEDNAFGISFSYPEEYGLISTPSDSSVRSFDGIGAFRYGSSVDSQGDRGCGVFDWTGFERRGDDYYVLSECATDSRFWDELVTPVDVIQTDAGEVIILRNSSMTKTRDYILSIGNVILGEEYLEENIAAILNIDKEQYSAVIFVTSGTNKAKPGGIGYEVLEDPLSLGEFTSVLRTLQKSK